eukprot:gene4890-biopygen1621
MNSCHEESHEAESRIGISGRLGITGKQTGRDISGWGAAVAVDRHDVRKTNGKGHGSAASLLGREQSPRDTHNLVRLLSEIEHTLISGITATYRSYHAERVLCCHVSANYRHKNDNLYLDLLHSTIIVPVNVHVTSNDYPHESEKSLPPAASPWSYQEAPVVVPRGRGTVFNTFW